MLDAKKRLAVLLIGAIALIAPFLVNQILILVDSPLNRTNINLFQTSTQIVYTYESGKYGESDTLELTILADSSTGVTSVIAEFDGKQESFNCDYETGKLIVGGAVSEYYTMFFIPVKNPMLTLGDFAEQTEFDIMDPIGILGTKNQLYTLRIGEKKVYWDVNPEIAGAQFSFIIDFYDSGDYKIGDGLMDSTCGFLEILEGGSSNIKLTILSPGNYEISRNRMNMLLWSFVIGIPLPFISYFILRKKDFDKDDAKEFTLLVAVAVSVVIIDIDIDVWFYAWLGQSGMIYLHLITAVVYALICLYLKYGIKWVFPAFLEVGFLFAMTTFVGDPYVPHLTAFMGLYASYLAMLFRSGFDKKEYDTKLDIIV